MITKRTSALVLALGLVPALGACNRNQPAEDRTTAEPAAEQTTGQAVRVTGVELGRSTDANGRIAANATTNEFSPKDTIFASVNTEGTASGTSLVARWTFQDGQVVNETPRTFSPTGPAITEFHISRPDGLAAGRYKVEIRLNGQTVETRDFEVK